MKRIIVLTVAFLICINLIGCGTSVEVSQAPASQTRPLPAENQIIPENFDRIEIGMTYDKVVEIFGLEGFHLKPDANDKQLYKWTHFTVDNENNVNEYTVIVIFKDGIVCDKFIQDHL